MYPPRVSGVEGRPSGRAELEAVAAWLKGTVRLADRPAREPVEAA
jgi:hypothetical protein